MDSIRISIIQTDIVWENKQENLRLLPKSCKASVEQRRLLFYRKCSLQDSACKANYWQNPNSGETITILKQWASRYGIAICGSYIAIDNGQPFYNRAFFLAPEGTEFYYDKRHLFRMGREAPCGH